MHECESCGSAACFVSLSACIRLCTECTSEFISWQLDGGMIQNPSSWAWAWDGIWPEAAPIGPIGWWV